MADENGNVRSIGDVIAELEQSRRLRVQGILEDVRESRSGLYHFLVNSSDETTAEFEGNLRLSVAGGQLIGRLSIPRAGYEATYQDNRLDTLLDRIDLDLSAGTVPWTPDYWKRKELAKEWNKALDGS